MATDNVVRLITIRGKAEGLDELTGKLKQLVDAQGNVVSVSEKQSKATSDLDKMAERYQRRLVEGYAQTQQFNKVQNDLTMLRNAGRISGEQYGAMLDKEAIRLGQTSALSNAFRQSLGGVQMQMVALSAGAGPVGVFLSGLGPWGMAGAVALGAVERAFGLASNAAHAFAQKARELRDVSDVTGLTINQLKALDDAGTRVGLSSDRVANGIERLTVSMDEVRRGTGAAYDKLFQFNPQLATEMARARDTASAIDILSRAYQNLDQSQQNALSRAFMGRSGIDMTRLLTAVNTGGGLTGVTATAAAAGKSIDENLIRRIAQLDIEIDEASKRMRNNLVKVFASDVLEAELAFYNTLNSIADVAGKFKLSTDLLSFITFLSSPIGGGGAALGKWVSSQFGGSVPRITANPAAPAESVPLPRARPAEAGAGTDPYAAERAYNDLNKWMTLLGPAATSAEHLALQQAKLSAENEKLGNRYGDLVIRAMEYNRVQEAGANLQIRVQIGVATSDAMRSQKLAELDQQLRKINATDAERTRALEIAGVAIQKDIELTQQQMAVRGAALPGLKQMELESGSLRTQLDQLSTTSLNNMTTALADMTMGTVTAADGFRNLGLQVVRSIEEMIIKMTIAKPIADALNSSLGSGGILSFLGIGGNANATLPAGMTGAVGPTGPILVPTGHAGMVAGEWSSGSRYVHPAYFDHAPRFHMGIDEVPAILQRGERVIPRGQNASGSATTIKQDITFKIDGAVGKQEIVGMIRQGMQVAKSQALSEANAAAPARQARYAALGS